MTAPRRTRVEALIERNKAGTINRIGRKSGIQVVESYSHHDGRYHYWNVLCGCGSRRALPSSSLGKKFGHSCGCQTKEILAKAHSSHGQSTGHGRRGSQAYRCWKSMWDRCTHSNRSDWMRYGGRGITICDRWKSFDNFFADMGAADEGLTLDRIDGDGNYEPGNCRWATQKEQANNRSSNHVISHNGETMTLSQWAVRLGLGTSTLWRRINKGMPLDRALSPGRLKRPKKERTPPRAPLLSYEQIEEIAALVVKGSHSKGSKRIGRIYGVGGWVVSRALANRERRLAAQGKSFKEAA